MDNSQFNCCLCGQEWNKDAGYAGKNGNNLCYECIVECAAYIIGGKHKLRQVVFGQEPSGGKDDIR